MISSVMKLNKESNHLRSGTMYAAVSEHVNISGDMKLDIVIYLASLIHCLRCLTSYYKAGLEQQI